MIHLREGVWTDADEHQFQRIKEHREAIVRAREDRLLDVSIQILQGTGASPTHVLLASAMRRHAADVRDALAPFDDGVRCKTEGHPE